MSAVAYKVTQNTTKFYQNQITTEHVITEDKYLKNILLTRRRKLTKNMINDDFIPYSPVKRDYRAESKKMKKRGHDIFTSSGPSQKS